MISDLTCELFVQLLIRDQNAGNVSVVRVFLTCVRGWHTLCEDTVCDDIKHAERKHHWDDNDAELEHVLHVRLQRE